MSTTQRVGALLCALGGLNSGISAAEPGERVSFLACPIARDTGPDTDVCFFAEHAGRRYALANPTDWGAPQLHHRVLVEGVVKDSTEVCGATAIEGRASVMREIDSSCGTVLPFDGLVKGAAGGVFNNGTPEQRAHAQRLAQRVREDPRVSIEPAILDPPPLPQATPPFHPRIELIIYPFNSTRGSGPDMLRVKELADFAKLVKARRVVVFGYRATSLLSDGTELTEAADIAQSRAMKITGIMERLGVSPKRLTARWQSDAIAGTGEGDWRNRKVEISVEP